MTILLLSVAEAWNENELISRQTAWIATVHPNINGWIGLKAQSLQHYSCEDQPKLTCWRY